MRDTNRVQAAVLARFAADVVFVHAFRPILIGGDAAQVRAALRDPLDRLVQEELAVLQASPQGRFTRHDECWVRRTEWARSAERGTVMLDADLDAVTFGRAVRLARWHKRLRDSELAALLGQPVAVVNALEAGAMRQPLDQDLLAALRRVLDEDAATIAAALRRIKDEDA